MVLWPGCRGRAEFSLHTENVRSVWFIVKTRGCCCNLSGGDALAGKFWSYKLSKSKGLNAWFESIIHLYTSSTHVRRRGISERKGGKKQRQDALHKQLVQHIKLTSNIRNLWNKDSTLWWFWDQDTTRWAFWWSWKAHLVVSWSQNHHIQPLQRFRETINSRQKLAQHGARTHDRWIKSPTLYRLS